MARFSPKFRHGVTPGADPPGTLDVLELIADWGLTVHGLDGLARV
jgi:hypothetical protein